MEREKFQGKKKETGGVQTNTTERKRKRPAAERGASKSGCAVFPLLKTQGKEEMNKNLLKGRSAALVCVTGMGGDLVSPPKPWT